MMEEEEESELNIDDDGYREKNDFFGSLKEMTTYATETKNEELSKYLTIVDNVYKLMGNYIEEVPLEESTLANLRLILSNSTNLRLIAQHFLVTRFGRVLNKYVDHAIEKQKHMTVINSVFIVIILEAFLLAINRIPRIIIANIYAFFNQTVDDTSCNLARSLLYAVGNLFVEDSMIKLLTTTEHEKMMAQLYMYSVQLHLCHATHNYNNFALFNRYIFTLHRAINYDISAAKASFLLLFDVITDFLFPTIRNSTIAEDNEVLMPIDDLVNIIALNLQWMCDFFQHPTRELYEKIVNEAVLFTMGQIINVPELKPVHHLVFALFGSIALLERVPEAIFDNTEVIEYVCSIFDAMDDDIDSRDMYFIMRFVKNYIVSMQDQDAVHSLLQSYNILQYVCIVMSETCYVSMLRICFDIFQDLRRRSEFAIQLPYAIEKSVLRDISSNILNYFETSIQENIVNNPNVDMPIKQETIALREWWQTLHQEYLGGDDVIMHNMGIDVDSDSNSEPEQEAESDMDIEPTEAQATSTQSSTVPDCCICLTYKSNTAFVKCGHMVTCNACAANRELKKCPVCRSNIDSKVRIYF